MLMLKEGDIAEDFSLNGTDGRQVTLSGFKGKKIVVYFYPKDNTPGCTKEACAFRDIYDRILEKGAVVLGISADSVKSHEGFQKKYNLPFYLLSDPDKEIIGRFGAWGEKNMYGKKTFGIIRSTFILNETGKVIKVFPKVKPEQHAEEILACL